MLSLAKSLVRIVTQFGGLRKPQISLGQHPYELWQIHVSPDRGVVTYCINSGYGRVHSSESEAHYTAQQIALGGFLGGSSGWSLVAPLLAFPLSVVTRLSAQQDEENLSAHGVRFRRCSDLRCNRARASA